jgi:SAM-dependent methyltransferase
MSSSLFHRLFDRTPPPEGGCFERFGRMLMLTRGIVRDLAVTDKGQSQTRDTFAFKWGKRETYQSSAMRDNSRVWLRQRYGDLISALNLPRGRKALVLDAGCGSGYSSSLLFENDWQRVDYVGVDISSAVDIAAESLRPMLADSVFVQADLMALPLVEQTFDLVLSEGVLHHTPSTESAFKAIARLVRPGGLYAIYVYAKKSPAREFTDDHIRAIVSELPPQQAWDLLIPLTKLGKALGRLDVEIDVPEDVAVLGIPKGRIDVQRLFYWHVCKLYYRPELSLEELNHINYDWFVPKYCHRHTPEQVRTWCDAAGLAIERLESEDAGITIVARRSVAPS